MPSVKDSLFGMLATRAGYATEEQLQECMKLQEEYRKGGGKVPRLGEILAQKGYMTAEQVEAVLQGQHREKGGLFGEIAVRWKFVTREQLDECLGQQQEEHAQGLPRRKIGEIMLYKGFIQVHQIAAILEAQKRRVIQCTGCDKYINIAGFRPGDKLKCASCGAVTEVPSMAGFSFADFRPQEAEVVPADTPEAARQEAQGPGSSGISQAISQAAEGDKQTLVIGGYEIIARMGQDSTGTTVKARHIESNTVVVLKVMKVTPMQDEAFLKRFIDEGKKGTQLIHKYVKRIYEVGLDKGRYFYSTEFVDGKSLKRLLDEGKRFTALEGVDIVLKVGQALSHAHSNGVVHGDLRPSNIIVCDDGGVKIAELGIAKDVTGNLRYFAKSSHIIPFYVAPELVVDESTMSPACDVYSLGAILYHLVAGRPPFEGENPLEVLMRITEAEAPSPYKLGVATEGLSKVIMKMISPEPEDRYNTMEEAMADLRDKLRDAALSTTRARKHEAGERIAKRRTSGHVAVVDGQVPLRTTTVTLKKKKTSGAAVFMWVVVVLAILGVGGYFGYREYVAYYGNPFAPPVVSPPPDTPPPDDGTGAAPAPEERADELEFRAALAYANEHPEDPKGAYERFQSFLKRYPSSPSTFVAQKKVREYRNAAAQREMVELLKQRDEALARNDFNAALAEIDAWLEVYGDSSERSNAIRMRETLLLDEQNFLARLRSQAKADIGNDNATSMDTIRDYVPTKLMEARKAEAIAELEQLIAEASAPAVEPDTVPETDLPTADTQPPAGPEEDAGGDDAAAAQKEIKALTAQVAKAAASFSSKRLEEAALAQPRHKAAAFIPEEAGRLAAFVDVIKARAERNSKGLTIGYMGARQQIASADGDGVVIQIRAGANLSDVKVPWGQLDADALWEIFTPLLKRDKDEAINLGLIFFYGNKPAQARMAWSKALTLGADGAEVKSYVDRLTAAAAPAPDASGDQEPSATDEEVLTGTVTFKGDKVRNYFRDAKGVWQTGPDFITVSGEATAEMPVGTLSRLDIRLKARGADVRALFGLGDWRIGIDGKEGKLIVQDAAQKEVRTPFTVTAGDVYVLGIEVLGDGTVFTVNGKIVRRDSSRKTQGGPLTIEVGGQLGVDLMEMHFVE
ncbi:MAG: protein kinase [Planctomycetes bacterium]|nr:protein kinase [Planctomycetota bacterium]